MVPFNVSPLCEPWSYVGPQGQMLRKDGASDGVTACAQLHAPVSLLAHLAGRQRGPFSVGLFSVSPF